MVDRALLSAAGGSCGDGGREAIKGDEGDVVGDDQMFGGRDGQGCWMPKEAITWI